MNTRLVRLGFLVLSLGAVGAGCKSATPLIPHDDLSLVGDQPDLVVVFQDDGGPIATDDGGIVTPPSNNCDPGDTSCIDITKGPPNSQFPLQSDPMKDPTEADNGVNRDPNGWLGLDSTHSTFNFLWIANAGEGTTSKIDSKTVREVARYSTVTCFSLKTGNKQACDGTNGCCAIDDYPRWSARKNKQPMPPHQSVQTSSNDPSRTAVDFNGELFISNRSFGGQSSVTKIANDVSECLDRNKNGKVETSSDVNGDGQIDTDCNGNGVKDDVDDVKAKACNNGMKQEYYGLDDECILWTSNTFIRSATGRPLGLAPGAKDSAVSDAWAGSYDNANWVRIDGNTGLDKDEAQMENQCHPYGLAVDSNGIGWAPNLGGGPLCFFDTLNSKNVNHARDAAYGPMSGYGVTLDRDQNVWVGSSVWRYTPDRTNGWKNLAMGYWTKINGAGGIGIAADSRNAKQYFVYSCSGNGVLQIPASTIPVPKGMDVTVNQNGWPTINMPCYGVGVDTDQNVWGVSMQEATRALVDKNGMITQPVVNGPVKGNNKCPAGDTCPMTGGPYTYSDFTGFGLRNFTRPSGTYSMIVKGCSDGNGGAYDTEWKAVLWDASVPPNTTLSVHARSGNTATPDQTWGAWTTEVFASPLDLETNLVPNFSQGMDYFLQVEFTFKTGLLNASPKLKSFDVTFRCGGPA